MLQQTAPSAAYPTPPPPGISSSSSSLAFALGKPPPKPAPRQYRVEESPQYFNEFLRREAAAPAAPVASTSHQGQPSNTPWRTIKESGTESPDPLALTPVTPHSRKRKAAQALESPTVKRAPSATPSTHSQSAREASTTPRESKGTPTPRKQKMQAFVELPPVPRLYPTPKAESKSSSQTPSHKAIGKRKAGDQNDLNGFASEEDDYGRNVKSSGLRSTADRSDQGSWCDVTVCASKTMLIFVHSSVEQA